MAPGEGSLRVLLAGTSFRAAYGGPALSVGRLAQALAAAGVEVGLWSGDGSVSELDWARSTPGVAVLAGRARAARAAFGAVDLIHDNGLWLPHNHELAGLARRLRIPRVVSTRGMLEPWALGHKRWKKRLAWGLYQRRDLLGAACHHVTSAQEGQNLRGLGLRVPIVLVPNGVDVPPLARNRSGGTGDGRRIALFLGRLYPVKGLPMLLEAWADVRPKGWRLRIAGPDEAGHRRLLEDAIKAFGLAAEVEFVGQVSADAKAGVYESADLFVLPSHSESFGMSVAEALAHRVPVLTTTAVPWTELADRGCGWRVVPDVQGLCGGLHRATALGPQELAAMGQRGRDWMAAAFSWEGVARLMVALYREALSQVEGLTDQAGAAPPFDIH